MQGKLAVALVAFIGLIAVSTLPTPAAALSSETYSDRAIAEMSVFGAEMDCPPARLFDYVKQFASFCKLFAKGNVLSLALCL